MFPFSLAEFEHVLPLDNREYKIESRWKMGLTSPQAFLSGGLAFHRKKLLLPNLCPEKGSFQDTFSNKLSPPSTFRPPSRRWLTLWGESVILKQLPNLLLRLRRCSTDSVICQVKKVNCLSLRHTYWPQRGLLIYKHIKWSAPHHRCQSRRFKGCFEITV